MTREEAIKLLKAMNKMMHRPDGTPISDVCDALGMAIEALSTLPSADAVEVKAEQLPPKVPPEWINDGMVLVPQHDWVEMQKELEGYASAEAEWIPCSERLPDVGEIVIASWSDLWSDAIVFARRYCEDDWEWAYEQGSDYWESARDYDRESNPEAWMPLPEPYEPKTERRG